MSEEREEYKTAGKRNSTVAISPDDAKKLEKFCKSISITKKDFISLALNYFLVNGINPAKHETPAQEIQKLIKKNDQVIAFIRTQEKDMLRPMLEVVGTMSARIQSDYVTKEDFKKLIDSVKLSYAKVLESIPVAINESLKK